MNSVETKTFSKCINFPPPSSDPGTFSERGYDEFSFSTRSELNQKLGISADIAAKGLWGSASAQASYFREVDIDDRSFYWVVNARYELLHESLATHSAEFRLSDLAQRVLQEHGWEAFKNMCGTHFYSGKRVGAQYALLYEFSAHDDKTAEALSAKAAASAFGVRASANFDSAVNTAESRHSLKVHSDIIGGNDAVGEYPLSSADLRTELEKLRRAVGHHRHGVPLRWEMSSYDMFPEVLVAKRIASASEAEDSAIEDALAFFYTRFTDNQKRNQDLKKLLDGSRGQDRLYCFSQHQLDKLDRIRADLVAQNLEIAQRAKQCIAQPTLEFCTLSDLALIDENHIRPEKDFSGLGSRDVTLAPSQDPHGQTSPLLNIVATSPSMRLYDTQCRVLQGRDGKIYAFAGAGRHFEPIGEAGALETSDGHSHPTICQNEYARRCSLRFVERFGTAPDGHQNDEILLVVFGEDGSTRSRNYFKPTVL